MTDSAAAEIQPQDLVLDLLGTYVRSGEPVWSGGLVRLLSDFGFSTGAARIALARLVNRELLERIREGRMAFYTVTPRTEALLAEGDTRIFTLGRRRTGPSWTLLWYAIPEEHRVERQRLSRRLRFLGFGALQDGLWIASGDRQALAAGVVAQLGVAPYVTMFHAQSSTALDNVRAAIERAWNLDELAARYVRFTDEFKPYLTAKARAALSDREAFVLRTRLIDDFRRFPPLDPELPDDLIERPLHREDAVQCFETIYGALEEPARRHFEATTAVGGPKA